MYILFKYEKHDIPFWELIEFGFGIEVRDRRTIKKDMF